MSLPERFWAKVKKTEFCWLWLAAKNGDGYGRFAWRGKNRHAHRLAYELLRGAIPQGMELDHVCRNRACVNPNHLEPVTHHANVLRGRVGFQREWTHCQRGHEFTPENTYIYKPTGRRRCRACHNVRAGAASKQWRVRTRLQKEVA